MDLGAGRVLSANPDGSDLKTIISEGRKLPDGLALDVAAGHIYWTNMGDPKRNDGSILRSDLNGKNMVTVVPPGATFTPKQLQLERRSGKLYWSDREGMRVMRVNVDGSEIETLVDTSGGDSRPGSDPRKWCVGIAVDTHGGRVYWTQKGGSDAGVGRICRANIQIPRGQSAEDRQDIPISMGRTGGRCLLLKETSPELHTRRCHPDIKRQRLDLSYWRLEGVLSRKPIGDERRPRR